MVARGCCSPLAGTGLVLVFPWVASLRSSPTVIHIEPLRGSTRMEFSTALVYTLPMLLRAKFLAPRGDAQTIPHSQFSTHTAHFIPHTAHHIPNIPHSALRIPHSTSCPKASHPTPA
jgi:hypothetical protein